MNQVAMQSIVQMDNETLKRLTTEVKETLATGINIPAKKKRFTSLSLWKIHQGKRQPAGIASKLNMNGVIHID
ncbi:MAG TPA: hypothetical protein DIC22_12660 [Chitinophagaceae bacterium]|nr:hypothetical protein [Chitinophagaceae bacterium]